MNERLTKESLQEWFDTVERINGARPDALAVWAKIEADREAIRAEVLKEVMTPPFTNKKGNEAYHRWAIDQARAETREELLQTHFMLRETVEFQNQKNGSWIKGQLVIRENSGQALRLWSDPVSIRRPPKKLAITREEKIKRLKEHLANQFAWLPGELKDATIDDLCHAFEIPTEVSE